MLRVRRGKEGGRGRDKRDILHGLGKLPKRGGERTKNSRERPFVARTIHILGPRLISSTVWLLLSCPKSSSAVGKSGNGIIQDGFLLRERAPLHCNLLMGSARAGKRKSCTEIGLS